MNSTSQDKDSENKKANAPKWLRKLQERWKVNSIWQVLIILLVFALTGFTVLYGKRWFFALIGLDENTAWYIKTLLWIVLILPVYQAVLLFYGTVFGQFTFFWNFIKRTFGKLFFFPNKNT